MAKKYLIDDARLCCMVDTARYVMTFLREERMRVTRAIAGSRYSSNASFKKVYVNLLSLYIKIVSRNLISQNPRVMLSTFDSAQKAAVSAAEMWMNQELIRQDFSGTMKRLIPDALMNMAVAKIGLATPQEAAVVGWGIDAGTPFISRVDIDDLVVDHRAREFDECSFIGHRIRVPLDTVRDDSRYDKKAREKLQASTQIAYNKEGDERIGQIWRSDGFYYEDLEDMVDLWEIYIPRHRTIKVFGDDCVRGPQSSYETGTASCLCEYPWVGHERGPYPMLGFEIVPGNLFPKGPLQDLVDLHEGANESYRKLMRQAARLKVNTVCRRDNPEDGESMRTAMDGQTVPVADPNSFKEVVQGGPHAGLYQWTRETIERFMQQAGNLATLGGLASQAGTLGQEELLAQQSNGQVASMQDAMVAFVSDCCDRMLWYYWNDPRLVMQAMNNDPNIPDVHHVHHIFPASHKNEKALRRVGRKPDIKIDPYTMRHQTPQQRLKDLMSVVTQIYVPLAQVAQGQGVALDFQQLLVMAGKYLDSPDLQTILTNAAPAQGQGDSPPSSGPSKPTSTTREYVRKSAGANSAAAQSAQTDNELSAAMAGGSGSRMNGQAS